MHIVIVNNTQIPVSAYGGTERVIWWLGKELVKLGHQVTYLAGAGSYCDFATVLILDPAKSLARQIPANADIVHLQYPTTEKLDKPVLTTIHSNLQHIPSEVSNCVFVSQNHAERHGYKHFVYNGIDFTDYGDPGLNEERTHFHFLGKAAWRIKNIKGAIAIANACKEKLVVAGGCRLNFKQGFRFTPYLNIKFKGMIGGEEKNNVLRHSKGLLFPVRWHEPFGLAIIESLYFGCPVFGTPYGSLPELVTPEIGFLSASQKQLAEHIKAIEYKPLTCHQYAVNNFNARKMASGYINFYQRVINGERLNPKHPVPEIHKDKFLPFY